MGMMKKHWWWVGLVEKVIGAFALPEVFRSSFRWQIAFHMRMCEGGPGEGEPTGYTRLLKLRNKIWLHLIKVAGSPPADGFRLGWGPADRGGPPQVGGYCLSCIVDGQSLSQVQISVGVPLHHRGGYRDVGWWLGQVN